MLHRRHAEFAELLQRRHAIKEFASTGSIPFLPFPPFLTLILICLMSAERQVRGGGAERVVSKA